MHGLSQVLRDADLAYLAGVTAPRAKEVGKLLVAMREDEDILLGMLRDPRLFRHLVGEPERVVTASPRLFFAALLVRVRGDLEQTSYTVEGVDRHRAAVFDSREVAGLIARSDVLAYLVGMLTSFLRVRTQSLLVRLRRGMWRRVNYSDLDLESLLVWGELAGPDELFRLWRRIGDVCLFRSGFFPASASAATPAAARREREKLAEFGRRYYAMASKHKEARDLAITETLEELATRFDMAVKPLALMASRYLDALQGRIFAG
jgi:hypothetical protein